MHHEVYSDAPACQRDEFLVGEGHVHERDQVVVPVQEDELLFPQHNEERVAQLVGLRECVQHHPEARGTLVEGRVTHGEMQAARPYHGEQVGECPQRPQYTEHGEHRAPHAKRGPEVSRRAARLVALCHT